MCLCIQRSCAYKTRTEEFPRQDTGRETLAPYRYTSDVSVPHGTGSTAVFSDFRAHAQPQAGQWEKGSRAQRGVKGSRTSPAVSRTCRAVLRVTPASASCDCATAVCRRAGSLPCDGCRASLPGRVPSVPRPVASRRSARESPRLLRRDSRTAVPCLDDQFARRSPHRTAATPIRPPSSLPPPLLPRR